MPSSQHMEYLQKLWQNTFGTGTGSMGRCPCNASDAPHMILLLHGAALLALWMDGESQMGISEGPGISAVKISQLFWDQAAHEYLTLRYTQQIPWAVDALPN